MCIRDRCRAAPVDSHSRRSTRSVCPLEENPPVSEVRIVAEPRTEFGKGGARRTRRAGKVPAVLYGHGATPRHVSLPNHDLMRALKGGANTLLRLDLGVGTELALPRAVTRDAIKGTLEHLDLLVHHAVHRRVAGQLDRNFDGDLLALAHQQQVEVLQSPLDGVSGDRPRQRQLGADPQVKAQQCVRAALERAHQVMARQADVAWRGPVAVEDGRHLSGPAGTASAALAELGARLGDDADLGHGGVLLKRAYGTS